MAAILRSHETFLPEVIPEVEYAVFLSKGL